MKKAIAVISLLATMSVLAACNTIEGIGKDIGSAGRSVERTFN